MTTIRLSMSPQPYHDKLQGNDRPGWANLYRNLRHVELDEAGFADAIYKGHVIAPVLDGWRSYDHFIAGQFIGIDMDTEDKRSAMSTLIDHDMVQMYGGILYSTQNSRPTAPRTRVIHFIDKPITDVYEYKAAIRTVSRAYAGYDRASAEPTRTFFGNYNLSKSHNVDGIWFSSSLLPLAAIEEMRRAHAAIDAINKRPAPNYADVDMDVDKFVRSCIVKAAPGNRNALCFWLSCRLVEKGVPDSEQEQAVIQFSEAMGPDFAVAEALVLFEVSKNREGLTMSKRDDALSLLEDKQIITVKPALATLIGLNEAIVLQQVRYWMGISSNERDGAIWVYKTYQEWQEEFPFWSVSTIRRAINSLEKDGLLISTNEYNRMAIDNTKWYTIPMNRPPVQNEQTSLPKMNRPPVQNEQANNHRVQTEITQENTTTTTSGDSSDSVTLAEVNTAYQNNIGLFTQMIAEQVADAYDEFGGQWIIDAIGIACTQNVRKWAYIDGILKKWAVTGKADKLKPTQEIIDFTQAAEAIEWLQQ